MFKVLIFCVIFEISTAAVCPGSPFTQAVQDAILNAHNNYRSELAKGLSTIKGGAKASGAKNMYEMTYNCALEQTAQTLANKCLGLVHSPDAGLPLTETGENLYWNNSFTSTIQSLMLAGISNWWSELATQGGITPTDVKFTMAMAVPLGHWTQMAWGKTTSVGCAFKACPVQGINMVVCHYKSQGNVLGADIYERGTACAADTDCTTVANSKCNLSTKLCYTGETTTSTTTTTTTTKPVTVAAGWTEWAPSTCTANCGLCGRIVMKRVCRSGSCPGSDTLLSSTACGSPSLCPFGLGLASCCAPAKRAIVNGLISCA